MNRTFTFIFVFIAFSFSIAQEKKSLQGPFGGEFVIEKTECISQQERDQIQDILQQNIADLQQRGILPATYSKRQVALEWPVRQADGFDYNSYYGISNYFDHDPAFSGDNNNNVLDYNCGSRSYDTGNGYNHQGVDIFTWPFGWHMMAKNQVEVVAAAAGTIIAKFDGNFDMECTFNSNQWNAVYIQHEDGSIAWYGHVKTGSLTAKSVGEQVEAGEYLAVVASSGNSTGPHLHFELYNESGQLIDPYSGDCNNLNEDSWWIEQKPYIEPTINTITTGWAAPEFFFNCPPVIPGKPNTSNCFAPGDVVFFSAYYHDQIPQISSNYAVYAPDSSLFTSWIHGPDFHYTASYWFWSEVVPNDAVAGEWRFEVVMNGDTLNHFFFVADEGVSAVITPFEETLTGCGDTGVDLMASGGDQYLWSTGDTSAAINVLASGTYFVTVINEGGCEAVANKLVTVHPIPATSTISGNPNPDAFTSRNYLVFGTAGSSYDWTITGGTQVSGGNTNIISVEWGEGPVGEVCVVETNEGGCVGEPICKDIEINPVTNLRKINHLARIDVFPNPTDERLNFRLDFDELVHHVQVRLLSALGQVILVHQSEAPTTHVQESFVTASLPAGLYWLEIKVNGERFLEKVILY